MKQAIVIASILSLFALLASCLTMPEYTSRNERVTCPQNEECVARDPKPSVHPAPRARESLSDYAGEMPGAFVGLALSGGGSRSANFALATMEQLDKIGILDHVTTISSTSGGGLAGAYFALNGDNIRSDDDWTRAKELMRTDFFTKWFWANFYPHNVIRTMLTDYDRTDIMMGIFDDLLFSGKVFADLGEPGRRRPIWIANSTDSWQHIENSDFIFRFSEEDFWSIGSRLDKYPLSAAVMGSAAFPGIFNSVTLSHYSHSPKFEDAVRYKHVFDGGPVDNLGLRLLKEQADEHQYLQNLNSTYEGCFLIIVDAYARGSNNGGIYSSDPGYFVDLNIGLSIDPLLTLRRREFLKDMGLDKSGRAYTPYIGDARSYVRVKSFGNMKQMIAPYNHLSYQTFASRYSHPYDRKTFVCSIWHISLAHLMSIRPYVFDEASGSPRPLEREKEQDYKNSMLVFRAKLQNIVSQIDTDFRLSGPENCSAEFLQQALYEAAYIAVREDHESREQVCEWFSSRGMHVEPNCKAFPEENRPKPDFDLVSLATKVNNVPKHTRDNPLECLAAE